MNERLLKEIANPFYHFELSDGTMFIASANTTTYITENRQTGDLTLHFTDGEEITIELAEHSNENTQTINRFLGFPLGDNIYD